MKKSLLIVCILFLVSISFAQTKPQVQVKKVMPELEKLLTASTFPFGMLSDSAAIIPFEGTHIDSFNVAVQKVSDLYIIYANLTKTFPDQINETTYKYLLEKNDHFDITKIGLNVHDNMMYLRADVYISVMNGPLMKRILQQVGNATNIIAGDLK